MEKDGLDEENGIKRIQMEELETDRHTHTQKQEQTSKGAFESRRS